MTVREVPGAALPSNMAPAALMNAIKRRFKDAGDQFLDIKLQQIIQKKKEVKKKKRRKGKVHKKRTTNQIVKW